jgi:hypothetical protein
LFKKFSPDNRIVSRVKLRTILNAGTVKVLEDPSLLFDQVNAIQNCYDTVTHKIDKEEVIAIVMGTAPKEYVAVITSEQ